MKNNNNNNGDIDDDGEEDEDVMVSRHRDEYYHEYVSSSSIDDDVYDDEQQQQQVMTPNDANNDDELELEYEDGEYGGDDFSIIRVSSTERISHWMSLLPLTTSSSNPTSSNPTSSNPTSTSTNTLLSSASTSTSSTPDSPSSLESSGIGSGSDDGTTMSLSSLSYYHLEQDGVGASGDVGSGATAHQEQQQISQQTVEEEQRELVDYRVYIDASVWLAWNDVQKIQQRRRHRQQQQRGEDLDNGNSNTNNNDIDDTTFFNENLILPHIGHSLSTCDITFTLSMHDTQFSPMYAAQELLDDVLLLPSTSTQITATTTTRSSSSSESCSTSTATATRKATLTTSPSASPSSSSSPSSQQQSSSPQQPSVVSQQTEACREQQSSPSGDSTQQQQDQQQRQPGAIFGAARSATSSTLSTLGSAYNIPQISSSSTSSYFDNKDMHRLFARTVPNNAGDAAALMKYLIQELAVRHVSILYVADEYGIMYHAHLVSETRNLMPNNEVHITSVSYTPAAAAAASAASATDASTTQHHHHEHEHHYLPNQHQNDNNNAYKNDANANDELHISIQQLHDAGNRYVIGIFNPETWRPVVLEAAKMNIMGKTSGYTWFLTEASLELTHPSFRILKQQPSQQKQSHNDHTDHKNDNEMIAYALHGVGIVLMHVQPHTAFDNAIVEFSQNLTLQDRYIQQHDDYTNIFFSNNNSKSNNDQTQTTQKGNATNTTNASTHTTTTTNTTNSTAKSHIPQHNLLLPPEPGQRSLYQYLAYDSVIAMAIASCEAKHNVTTISGSGGGRERIRRRSRRRRVQQTKVDNITGEQLYKQLLQTEFMGVSGRVRFDHTTGTRLRDDFRYEIKNLILIQTSETTTRDDDENDNDNNYYRYETRTIAYVCGGGGGSSNGCISGGDVVVYNTNDYQFIYADNTTNIPIDLPPLDVDMNLIPVFVRIIGYCCCGLVAVVSIVWIVWTYWHRKIDVVRSSQPIFLCQLCIGTLIMAMAIIPMSYQESYEYDLPQRYNSEATTSMPQQQQQHHIQLLEDEDERQRLDMACMSIPWLLSIGFVTAFSALFSKTWRLNKLLHHGMIMRRIIVRPHDVILPFLLLMTINIGLLISWTIHSPLVWVRLYDEDNLDRYGRYVESYGMCRSSSTYYDNAAGSLLSSSNDNKNNNFVFYYYLIPIVIIDASALIFANYQAYKARLLPTEFSESSYIGISMISLLESFVLSIPLLVMSSDHPTTSYLLRTSLVTISCFTILLPIFIPKFIQRNIIHDRLRRNRTTRSRPAISSNATTIALVTRQQQRTASRQRQRDGDVDNEDDDEEDEDDDDDFAGVGVSIVGGGGQRSDHNNYNTNNNNNKYAIGGESERERRRRTLSSSLPRVSGIGRPTNTIISGLPQPGGDATTATATAASGAVGACGDGGDDDEARREEEGRGSFRNLLSNMSNEASQSIRHLFNKRKSGESRIHRLDDYYEQRSRHDTNNNNRRRRRSSMWFMSSLTSLSLSSTTRQRSREQQQQQKEQGDGQQKQQQEKKRKQQEQQIHAPPPTTKKKDDQNNHKKEVNEDDVCMDDKDIDNDEKGQDGTTADVTESSSI